MRIFPVDARNHGAIRALLLPTHGLIKPNL
jgi:hypothetical protein